MSTPQVNVVHVKVTGGNATGCGINFTQFTLGEKWVHLNRPGEITCSACQEYAADNAMPKFLVFEGKVRVFDNVEAAEDYIEHEALQREDPPSHIAVTMVPSSWKETTLVYENRGFVMTTPTEADNWEES